MKKTSIVVFLALTIIQMPTANSSVAQNLKFNETLLVNNLESIQNPYFQIKKAHIHELTSEEALEFANDDDVSSATVNGMLIPNRTMPNIPGIPTIPPIPPQAGNFPQDDGGIVVGRGPGGNIPAPVPIPIPRVPGPLDGVITVVDQIVAIGTKVMPLIDKGRAVVTNNPMSMVSVLPRIDGKDPVVHDMGNWSIPVSKHYRISYENGLGMEVVSFVYSITFQHSGTYKDKGKYLTGIRASARNITVSWGFDLDANSQLLQISNVGTADNVIAGATMEIVYTVKNWTRTMVTAKSFHVTGDGRIFQLD